ncbi:MAG: AbrB family transcriptional regulator, partial [Pseudomonadota bacterium]
MISGFVPVLTAFAAALVGVAVFFVLDLPLPWLLGPILASLLAALAGLPLKGIKPVNDGMRTVLGVAVGATLTPAVIATFPAMWPTLVLIPIMVAAI